MSETADIANIRVILLGGVPPTRARIAWTECGPNGQEMPCGPNEVAAADLAAMLVNLMQIHGGEPLVVTVRHRQA